MNKEEILKYIANNKGFKWYCYKLCKGRDIHNDLFQQMWLHYAEKDEEYLLKLYELNKIKASCMLTMTLMNLSRRQKHKAKFSNNNLYEYSNEALELTSSNISNCKFNYDINVDVKFNEVLNYLSTSEDVKIDEVLILFETLDKSLIQISKETGIHYQTMKNKAKSIKDKIKQNVSI